MTTNFEEKLKEYGILKNSYYSYPFQLGRSALKFLIKAQNWHGKSIIFPAFLCPSLIEATISAGAIPILVDINLKTFHMNIEPYIAKIDWDNVTAIFANHTLGYPMDIPQLKSLLKQHIGKDIPIIEDFAHALFSKYNNSYLSFTGDYVLVSLYKQFPNPYGSVLFSKNELNNYENLPTHQTTIEDIKMALYKRNGIHQPLVNLLRRITSPSLPTENNIPEPQKPHTSILKMAINHLEELKIKCEQKNKISKDYFEYLRQYQQFEPQTILAGFEPSWFSFNIRIKEPNIPRDTIYFASRRNGTFIDRIWYNAACTNQKYKQYCIDECINASNLAKTIMNLPLTSSSKSVIANLGEAISVR